MIQQFSTENSTLHLSAEDLGGRSEEVDDPHIKEVVVQLRKIADEINQNAELSQ